jgi:hypothetical protein
MDSMELTSHMSRRNSESSSSLNLGVVMLRRRGVALLLAGVTLAASGLGGCTTYSARDEYFAARALYVSARPGTGELVAFAQPVTDENAQRLARSSGGDTPLGGE